MPNIFGALKPEHIVQALRIERASFEFPLDDRLLTRALLGDESSFMVLKDGVVIGYVVWRPVRRRIYLLNLAVDPEKRMGGVGRELLQAVRQRGKELDLSWIVADVREVNLGAQKFFRACGFMAVKVLERYFDNGENAYRFVDYLNDQRECEGKHEKE